MEATKGQRAAVAMAEPEGIAGEAELTGCEC